MIGQKNTAVLLIHCPDKPGIVFSVTQFLLENKGNIIDLDQHVDVQNNIFFMRVEWELDGFQILDNEIDSAFANAVGTAFSMEWKLHFTKNKQRMAIFVTKKTHCLHDILQRHQSKEWDVEIPLIISNHPNLSYIAERFDIPFYVFPINKTNKAEQEAKELELLRKHRVDFVVLARYMQIISPDFIKAYENRIINIHHSFLPAFPGAKPYHQAYLRGVKIIGATSHYVTDDLDAGPIIAQDIARISHQHTIQDLVRKGRDVEKTVLSKAIWNQIQHNILSYDNRTIVF